MSENKNPKKMSVELDDLDVDFDGDSWVMLDVTITTEAEDGKPGREYEGKLLVCRIPKGQV